MNWVAHIFLSHNIEEIVVGNWLGDISRGRDYLDYEGDIPKGIMLHRKIDTFTDVNPLVHEANQFLYESQGKYAPVVTDLFFDYFLIENWEEFSDESYDEFKDRNYKILKKYEHLYPYNLKKRTQALIKYDWFNMYRTMDGLDEVLAQLSVRTQFPNNMANASAEIRNHKERFNAIFLEFFPQLNQYSIDYLEQNEI